MLNTKVAAGQVWRLRDHPHVTMRITRVVPTPQRDGTTVDVVYMVHEGDRSESFMSRGRFDDECERVVDPD